MSDKPFVIYRPDDQEINLTLAEWIRGKSGSVSWGDARKIVSGRRIQINGNLCLDPARRIQGTDVIKIWELARPKPVSAHDLRFIHVDDDIVVVEKPAGVTSVRHVEEKHVRGKRKQLQPTLEELMPVALAHYVRERRLETKLQNRGLDLSAKRKRSQMDLARDEASAKKFASRLPVIAVHRLDRDTSGLMLFARTRRAAIILGEAFRKHAVDRRYQAVVLGDVQPQSFDTMIARDRGDGKRGSVPLDQPIPELAQHAITHVRPIESLGKKYSIVECKLETGRTHQIRIHLSEAGHPLCGDNIYNHPLGGKPLPDKSSAPRQALHSTALRFVHPTTGEIMKFVTPWPSDLAKWIERLRSDLS